MKTGENSGNQVASSGESQSYDDESYDYRRRNKVETWLGGANAVQDGLFENYAIYKDDRVVGMLDPTNVDEFKRGLEAKYGEEYPDLFPDTTGLAEGHDRRASDIFAYPEMHAQAPQGALADQPNTAL